MIEILIKIVSIIFLMTFAFAIGFGLWRVIEIPLRRWRESAFEYVYVDDNGNARELNAAEEEYVTTALFPDEDADQHQASIRILNRRWPVEWLSQTASIAAADSRRPIAG